MNFAMRLFVLILFFSPSLFAENAIPAFSANEKEHLNHILHCLFKFDHFSYTLFSDKPISIFSEKKIHLENINTLQDLERYCITLSYPSSYHILEKSWDFWQLKFSKVQFKNFLFFEKKSPKNSMILLINKQAFSNLFAAHKELFKKNLGEAITEQSLLNKIQSCEFSLQDALNNSEELLGLLLGFGHYNAKLFEQRCKLYNNHILDIKFKNDEISRFERKLSGISPTNAAYFTICTVSPMGFMVDIQHSETKKLLKKYDNIRRQIAPILQNRQIVDGIISQLTKE